MVSKNPLSRGLATGADHCEDKLRILGALFKLLTKPMQRAYCDASP
jgi:hypothetical protein